MKTYSENGKYYAVIVLPSGQVFYRGPYNNRSKARRESLRESKKQREARKSGMIVNYHI